MGGGTGPARSRDDDSMDVATVTADDRLLDLLGAGRVEPDADPAARLLGAWRADLDTDLPELPRVPDAWPRAGGAGLPRSGRGAGPRRLVRTLVAAAAMVAVLAALGLSARNAGPGSALWPITRLAYPQQAEVRAAEQAIALARQAATAGRVDEARRRLDEAGGHTDRVRDPVVAGRLRAEIEELRRRLTAATAGSVPAGPTPAPAATPRMSPAPAGSPPAGGPVPGLPPVGTPPLPLPSVPLPGLSGLPGLPGVPPVLPSGLGSSLG